MKGNCGECERRWFCDINPDECDAWPDPVPQTNADHIRSMTDEELAVVLFALTSLDGSIEYCKSKKECVDSLDSDIDIPDEWCRECLLDWLKQPYGGDT